jgi:hypothetical protein
MKTIIFTKQSDDINVAEHKTLIIKKFTRSIIIHFKNIDGNTIANQAELNKEYDLSNAHYITFNSTSKCAVSFNLR